MPRHRRTWQKAKSGAGRVKKAGTTVGSKIKGGVGRTAGTVKRGGGAIKSKTVGAVKGIGGGAKDVGGALKDVGAEAYAKADSVKDKAADVAGDLKDIGTDLVETAKDVAPDVKGAITTYAKWTLVIGLVILAAAVYSRKEIAAVGTAGQYGGD